MDTSAVVEGAGFGELPARINRIPEERVVQIFASDCPQRSLNQRVRHRGIGEWLRSRIDSQRNKSTLQKLSLACAKKVSQEGC